VAVQGCSTKGEHGFSALLVVVSVPESKQVCLVFGIPWQDLQKETFCILATIKNRELYSTTYCGLIFVYHRFIVVAKWLDHKTDRCVLHPTRVLVVLLLLLFLSTSLLTGWRFLFVGVVSCCGSFPLVMVLFGIATVLLVLRIKDRCCVGRATS